jgi:hypothetical protein
MLVDGFWGSGKTASVITAVNNYYRSTGGQFF